MDKLLKLSMIGILGGIVLAGFLLLVHLLVGSGTYILLFNVDYIPILKNIWSQPAIGIVFHFIFCIGSVIVLYYVLSFLGSERNVPLYILIYAVGSAGLFFLTALSNMLPAATDYTAWSFWTFAHVLYGATVGTLVKYWV